MYLLAEASGGNAFGWLFMILIFVYGTGKVFTSLGGNRVARGAAKRGGIAILRNIFK